MSTDVIPSCSLLTTTDAMAAQNIEVMVMVCNLFGVLCLFSDHLEGSIALVSKTLLTAIFWTIIGLFVAERR